MTVAAMGMYVANADDTLFAQSQEVPSTPSDLVRFALATNPSSVNGELAGGMVMSLTTKRDSNIVVAVTSNMAHANTSALALRVETAFHSPR